MKKWIGLVLALAVALGTANCAWAQQETIYQQGDKMDDFAVTLSDGTQVTLYGLLAEKKAVLINFWASWCRPCKIEFPAMQRAYDEMSEEIGIVALSCEKSDTDETVRSLKEELGLTTLPMGIDNGLSERFERSGLPTSVLVDRNGVVCYQEAGSIPDENQFLRLFSVFTAEDYAGPVLLDAIPAAARTAADPDPEALRLALGVQDARVAVTGASDESFWPFVPAADGAGVEASNGASKDTRAALRLAVQAEAGEGLYYELALSCAAVMDGLTVAVDGAAIRYYGGEADWKGDCVRFETAGAHTVEFVFDHGADSFLETAGASLRGVRLLAPEEEAAFAAGQTSGPRVLSGVACEIEPLGEAVRSAVLTQKAPEIGENRQMCSIVKGDTLTVRVKIGAEVDERRAYIADSGRAAILADLPRDEEGYLFTGKITGTAQGATSPANIFYFGSSVLDAQNSLRQTYICFASEAEADAYVRLYQGYAAAAGMTDYSLTWAYADGSPKGGETAAGAAQQAGDGMARYVISVADESGAPVAGAMIQICDEGTCLVVPTDGDGRVVHEAARFPYEIHLLMAPEGYAPDANTYLLPEEGGEITITLVRQ